MAGGNGQNGIILFLIYFLFNRTIVIQLTYIHPPPDHRLLSSFSRIQYSSGNTEPILMRLLLIILCLASVAFCKVQAQIVSDTLVADKLLQEGDSLLEAGSYQSAKSNFEKALVIFENSGITEKHVRCLNLLSGSIWRLGDLDRGLSIAKEALEISTKYLDSIHVETANAHYNIGIIHMRRGNYDKALDQQFAGLEIRNQLFDSTHQDVASSYNLIAIVYSLRGYYDEAVGYYAKALIGFKNSLGADHSYVGNVLNNIGSIHFLKKDYEQALEYFFQVLAIMKKNLDDNHPNVATCYNNIGNVFNYTGRYEEAIINIEKSLEIREKIFGPIHTKVAQSLLNLGTVYQSLGDWDTSTEIFQKALSAITELFGENHQMSHNIIIKLGEICKEKGELDSATYYIHHVNKLLIDQLGRHHEKVARSFRHMGDLSMMLGDPDEALRYYYKAIEANIPEFRDTSVYSLPNLSKSILDPNELLRTLHQRALVFNSLYTEKSDSKDLEYSLLNFQLCDSLIHSIRNDHVRFKDKFEFEERANNVYSDAVRVCYDIFKESNRKLYSDIFFNFVESAKSATLSHNVADQYAKDYSGIDPKILEHERKLKIDRSYYLSKIYDLEKSSEVDTSMMEYLRGKLFQTNSGMDSLLSYLENTNPEYYKLKYNRISSDLDKLQRSLPNDQLIINFFEGDREVYIMAINYDSLSIYSVELDSEIEILISALASDPYEDTVRHVFRKTSAELFNKLVKPGLKSFNRDFKEIIIVPDGHLNYIPFEILIQNEGHDDLSYVEMPYIIKDYVISYRYSTSFITSEPPKSPQNSEGTILAFAPSYSSQQDFNQLASQFRDKLQPLKWNKPELDVISEFFDGEFVSGEDATELVFKSNSQDYKILHLAMHAVVDNEKPMQSKLIFFQNKDSLEDGMLHPFELLNMTLPAEMAVLSACNTGIGKLQKGEGVMSLGRAFSYAGCPSVVMSHWSVDDQSTSEIMGAFYKYLAEGEPKDVALRLAKLDFLETAQGIRTHPYYWASFIVLGDTSPISKDYNWWLYIGAGIGIILVIVLYMRNRERLQI